MHTARVGPDLRAPPPGRFFGLLFTRALLSFTLLTGALGVLSAVPPSASAAPSRTPVGSLAPAHLDTFNHRLTVSGWAYVPARTSASITVKVYVDGAYVGHVTADRPSPGVDASRRITGAHTFRLVRTWTKGARAVTVSSVGIDANGPAYKLDGVAVAAAMPAPGSRIVTVARRYVGARYVEGGASPSGFDCSGFTKYVFAAAKVRTLPHSAEGQRRMTGMRRITRSTARPGDLVFYLSGGSAYHVAVYAGNGRQYAAATPRDGVRYQPVWSSAVEYRTDWH
jgi:cell wall-associated NlpC family hydrolase